MAQHEHCSTDRLSVDVVLHDKSETTAAWTARLDIHDRSGLGVISDAQAPTSRSHGWKEPETCLCLQCYRTLSIFSRWCDHKQHWCRWRIAVSDQGGYVFIGVWLLAGKKNEKNTRPIFTKFGGKVTYGPRKNPLDFGGNPNHVTLDIVGCGYS